MWPSEWHWAVSEMCQSFITSSPAGICKSPIPFPISNLSDLHGLVWVQITEGLPVMGRLGRHWYSLFAAQLCNSPSETGGWGTNICFLKGLSASPWGLAQGGGMSWWLTQLWLRGVCCPGVPGVVLLICQIVMCPVAWCSYISLWDSQLGGTWDCA